MPINQVSIIDRKDLLIMSMAGRIRFSYGSLGLLVGLITGMTATSVVGSLLGLLFAFIGGSAIALQGKLTTQQQQEVYTAISSLCICCIVGIFAGIAASEWQIVSPSVWERKPSQAAAGQSPTAKDEAGKVQGPKNKEKLERRYYLKGNPIAKIDEIDTRLRQKLITEKEAYEEI